MDIYFSPHDQYFCSQLYLTGNRAFFKRMKEQAKANHFLLTEVSLSPEYAAGNFLMKLSKHIKNNYNIVSG